MVKLSDYVFDFIAQKGIKHVFMLPGGGCMHLVDSLGKNKDLEYVCCLHEQAVAIAAEAYGQHTNNTGIGLVTSGPGSTNSITGVAAAWIDSTPCIFISGQAKRSDLMYNSGVRQMGSQEVDIVSMVKHITKYAVMILEPSEIRYHLEKAYYLAMNGRRGPVWLDIPLDVQGCMIDENELCGFSPEKEVKDDININEEIKDIIELINASERPVILVGNGVKLSGAHEAFYEFIEKANMPVLTTWKVIDLMAWDNPLCMGSPGTMGQRYSNFILQNADLLIVLGSRLDASLTAFNHANFGKNARKVIVDIDKAEIHKMKLDFEVTLNMDICRFFEYLHPMLPYIAAKDRNIWFDYCIKMKAKYPVIQENYRVDNGYVNAYLFIDKLCDMLNNDDIIVPESSGSAGEITYQAFKVKIGQKIKNAAGLGSMGFGLPYAIGSCLANMRKRTILINGDGAFQLNIQELQTVVRLNLPIKIFIWNNNGYASIMASQRNLFDGRYVASEESSGLLLPDIIKIAKAYGIKTFQAKKNDELNSLIEAVLNTDGPVLCELMTSPYETVAPKVQSQKTPEGSMISKPLEDMWPFLDEDELRSNMIGETLC